MMLQKRTTLNKLLHNSGLRKLLKNANGLEVVKI